MTVSRSRRGEDDRGISIIINNYNYARYLRACIDSVLEQGSMPYEIIVVDDGSTDGSADILDSYGGITVVKKSNGGQASALNAGFSASSLPLIWFLDSDDILLPGAVKSALSLWSDDFCKLHFPLSIINESGERIGQRHPYSPLGCGDLIPEMLRVGYYTSAPTSGNIFSRQYLDKVMPIPVDAWRGHADCYLIFSAPFYGRVGCFGRELAGYRIHGQNMTSFAGPSTIDAKRLDRELNRDKMQKGLVRLRASEGGLTCRDDIVDGKYYHLILRILKYRLSGPSSAYRDDRLGRLGRRAVAAIMLQSRFPKKLALLLWLLACLALPAKPLERVAARIYKRG